MTPEQWIGLVSAIGVVVVPIFIFMSGRFNRLHSDHAETRNQLTGLKAEMEARVKQLEQNHSETAAQVNRIESWLRDTREYLVEQFATIKAHMGIVGTTKNEPTNDRSTD